MWGNGSIENQYLQNYYIHKSKKNVFMNHNKIKVYQHDFEIDQQYLFLDLYNEEGNFTLIKLFDEEKYPDLKLVKYHASESTQSVIFFFHQRNKVRSTGIYNNTRPMTGVHFFVIRRFNEIIRHLSI